MCAGNPRRVSCAIEILSFQNFYKVLKTCSARRKDFFDTLISVWAGDKSRHFAQLSHASQNPGRYWYRSSNAWPEILASANVPKIYTFTKIAHLQFIAGLHLPLEARILMKAGGGACIGSAGVDACSFLLPHHVFSKYSLYPRRKLLRKATSLETRNQKFFAQKEKEFKQKPEFLNFLEVTPGFELAGWCKMLYQGISKSVCFQCFAGFAVKCRIML